jgi:uncharacterized glyoxalase superfamily protein PhnB
MREILRLERTETSDMEQSITPTIFYRDPIAAMRWLENVFGFESVLVVTDDAGNVGHAEMGHAGMTFGVGGEWSAPNLIGPAALTSPASLGGVGTQFMRISVEGIDAHFARAKAAGAHITQEPTDQFYGDRTYRALDLEGHVWNFREKVRDLSQADQEAASGLKYRVKA